MVSLQLLDFSQKKSPRKMSADSSLNMSRDGEVESCAQEKSLFRMETWREELKPAGFGPEVHHQRLPGDRLFCLKINQAKGRSISTVLSYML